MVYSYVLTLQDFLDSQKLCLKRNPRARLVFLFWHRFMPILGASAVYLLVRDIVFHHFSYPSALGGALFGIAWLGLYPAAMRPFLLRKLFRQMRPKAEQNNPIELEISGDDLISRIPGRSEGRFKQVAILDFMEDDKIALIFIAKKKFLVVPKNEMGESDLNELRVWLAPVLNRARKC